MTIGITGHQRLDNEAAWPWVQNEIENILAEHPDAIGVSSLAVGADQLFAEVLLERAKRLIAVIPSDDYQNTFKESEVDNYNGLLAKASEEVRLDFASPSEEAFYAAGKKVADMSDLIIAVWNGKPAKGLGGTADIVQYAKEHRKDVIHLNPDTLQAVHIDG